MSYLTEQQKKDIGLQFVLDRLNILSPFGVELLNSIRPFKPQEKDQLMAELDNLGQIKDAYHEHRDEFTQIFNILSQFKDIRPSIDKCLNDKDYVLNEIELFEIKNFLLSLKELVGVFSGLQEVLRLDNVVLREIPWALTLLDPEGRGLRSFYISDTVSPLLRDLRKEKRRLEAEITASNSGERKQRLRDERLLIVCKEEDEEFRIRKSLTVSLVKYTAEFFENAAAIGRLDLLLQKGKLAAENQTTRPVISENVVFADVYNPYIAYLLYKRNKNFTPVSITLQKGTAVLTGANMGGKSVALKTFTLNILLFQMGFFVFAKNAELPLFDCVHLISEDLQSIDKGLSTFAAEIVRLQQISVDLNRGFSFVALDEFARGTNPSEGAGLARAVAKYLNKKNAISILTTHYDNVSSPEFLNYQVVGLKNLDLNLLRQKLLLTGAKAFSLISEHMDYRLQKAEPDSEPPKDALNICRLLNLTEDILQYYEG